MNVAKILTDRISGKAPKGAKRSSQWRKVRAKHLHDNPKCACCGSKKKVEVHHVVPFHIAPDLELSQKNLLTLCENKKYGVNCHLLLGHLGNYRRINIDIEMDVLIWKLKIHGRA